MLCRFLENTGVVLVERGLELCENLLRVGPLESKPRGSSMPEGKKDFPWLGRHTIPI